MDQVRSRLQQISVANSARAAIPPRSERYNTEPALTQTSISLSAPNFGHISALAFPPALNYLPRNTNGYVNAVFDDQDDSEDWGFDTVSTNTQIGALQDRSIQGSQMSQRTNAFATAQSFQPRQTYRNGAFGSTVRDASVGARGSLTPPNYNNRPNQSFYQPPLPEQPLFMDPRTQQMLATTQMRSPYPAVVSPYPINGFNPLPTPALSPYFAISGQHVDTMIPDREEGGRESVQSVLLWEFRSNPKSSRWDLIAIRGHVSEFSGDQYGSRYIQNKLETANSDEKNMVFSEIEPNILPLMKDIYGNYVVQKFYEFGDQTHKRILTNKMKGHVRDLSISLYGCRVIQKALEYVMVDQQDQIVSELRGHVLGCVENQNGNHVIQKAIEICDPKMMQFVYAELQNEVMRLSTHTYGCRVIQRCLEHSGPHWADVFMQELLLGIEGMIQDAFGNYVVQHIVENDEGVGRARILDIVGRQLEMYSKHKFASNVVEKALKFADDEWKRRVALTIASGTEPRGDADSMVVSMIKDQYGNYVIRECLIMIILGYELLLTVFLQKRYWMCCSQMTVCFSSNRSDPPSAKRSVTGAGSKSLRLRRRCTLIQHDGIIITIITISRHRNNHNHSRQQ
jgi:hypothetical protein